MRLWHTCDELRMRSQLTSSYGELILKIGLWIRAIAHVGIALIYSQVHLTEEGVKHESGNERW